MAYGLWECNWQLYGWLGLISGQTDSEAYWTTQSAPSARVHWPGGGAVGCMGRRRHGGAGDIGGAWKQGRRGAEGVERNGGVEEGLQFLFNEGGVSGRLLHVFNNSSVSHLSFPNNRYWQDIPPFSLREDFKIKYVA